ncbi:MAG: hypothetical protein MJZ00_05315 [Paludibacteraceae bacterium]|mgnify:CR=1 FL=1|nr:hypothetical protein [Paludibacteraceae bacterium]
MTESKEKMIRNKNVVVNLNEKEYQALSQYCEKHKLQKSDVIRNIVFKEIMAKQYEESPTLFD